MVWSGRDEVEGHRLILLTKHGKLFLIAFKPYQESIISLVKVNLTSWYIDGTFVGAAA